LLFATFFVQVLSTLSVLAGRRGRFVVTAKRGADHAQPGAVLPTLLVMCLLLAAMGYGLMSFTAASLNNVAFALLHLSVLAAGSWTALVGRRRATLRSPRHRDPAPLEELVA
jgi:hypothetical protein